MRIIGHLDMDAFFAAVEERDNPQWRGRPIVVGSDPKNGFGRGVVSTANYAARKYGIHSALPIRVAWQRAETARLRGEPATIFLPGSWRRYNTVSRRIMALLTAHFPYVQQRSVDEAYFDLSGAGSYTAATHACTEIKQKIVSDHGLTASVGIGPNKLIAKIASDHNKPDGLTVVPQNEVQQFLNPLPIRVIPGIGPKTEQLLQKKAIQTIEQALHLSPAELHAMLGKWGDEVFLKLRGYDDSPLHEPTIAKSLGEQTTLPVDTLSAQSLFNHLFTITQNLITYLHEDGFQSFRTIVLTVRFADFETLSRSRTLKKPTNSLDTLRHHAIQLFLPFLDHRANPHHKFIRLLGVRLEKLK